VVGDNSKGYGAAFRKGLSLARRDLPILEDHCSFHFEDHEYVPRKALSALRQLQQTYRVKLVALYGEMLRRILAR